jgi:hypothetical protein
MKTAAWKQEFVPKESKKDDRVFRPNREGPAESRIHNLNLNRLNSGMDGSKGLEVSWRIDHKGKAGTVTGSWKGCRREAESNNSSSPEHDTHSSDSFQEEGSEHHSSEHDVEIVPNGNGVKYTHTKLQYKWPGGGKKSRGAEGKGTGSSFSSKNSSKQLLLDPLGQQRNGNGVGGKVKLSTAVRPPSNYNQPRSSSVKGISRAKIKTVKLTVTVICCYIFCSSPFIAAQLWVTFDPDAVHSPFYTGE